MPEQTRQWFNPGVMELMAGIKRCVKCNARMMTHGGPLRVRTFQGDMCYRCRHMCQFTNQQHEYDSFGEFGFRCKRCRVAIKHMWVNTDRDNANRSAII